MHTYLKYITVVSRCLFYLLALQQNEEEGGRKRRDSLTHMSLIIQFIVGQFEFVETDHLSHPSVSRSQRIRVYINSWGDRGISIASHHPLGAMIHISDREREREFRDRCREGVQHPENKQKQKREKTKKMTRMEKQQGLSRECNREREKDR